MTTEKVVFEFEGEEQVNKFLTFLDVLSSSSSEEDTDCQVREQEEELLRVYGPVEGKRRIEEMQQEAINELAELLEYVFPDRVSRKPSRKNRPLFRMDLIFGHRAY